MTSPINFPSGFLGLPIFLVSHPQGNHHLPPPVTAGWPGGQEQSLQRQGDTAAGGLPHAFPVLRRQFPGFGGKIGTGNPGFYMFLP